MREEKSSQLVGIHPPGLFALKPRASKSALPQSASWRFREGGGGGESGSSMFKIGEVTQVPNRYVCPVTCGSNERIFQFKRMRNLKFYHYFGDYHILGRQ